MMSHLKALHTKTGALLLALTGMLACGGPVVGFPLEDGGTIVAPTVISTIPADAATGVASDAAFTATFSTGMDGTTLTSGTFSVMNGATAVAGTVTSSGSTATFTPAAALPGSTQLTATLTTGVK